MNNVAHHIAGTLSRGWWLLLLRGLIAIAFGVLTWLRPGISVAALVLLFGAYALADGSLAIWNAVAGRQDQDDWWVMLLGGLVGVGIGVVTLVAPGLTALALLFYIAAWAFVTGVLEIVAAVRLRKEIQGEWVLILAGLASVGFALLLFMRPMTGALTLLWLIAAYAVVFGVLLVMLAFRARSFASRLAHT
jgi:uncharacterized membrane protein HdeD (DUF308 family)